MVTIKSDEASRATAVRHHLSAVALVLNGHYEPLNVTMARRALVLVLRGRAEMVEDNNVTVRSTEDVFFIPSVIRLNSFVRRPLNPRRLTR